MRISSQGTIIMIDDGTDPAPIDIVSATKAKPCTITVAAGASPVVGDIIVPRGTGWNSIEAMPFKVSAAVAGVVTLEDSDTTREANAILIGTIEVPAFVEMCRSSFTANQPAGATIDVTTLCDTAHRIVAGLPAIGTWTAPGFYDCQDTALERARDAYRSGEDVVIDVRLPDGCGLTFMGIVQTFDVTLGINAAVANTVGGQIDGRVNFYKTPAPGFVPLVGEQAMRVAPRPPTDQPPQQVAA
jgi:hypothetical protein